MTINCQVSNDPTTIRYALEQGAGVGTNADISLVHVYNPDPKRFTQSQEATRYLKAMKVPRELTPWKGKDANAIFNRGTTFLLDPHSTRMFHTVNDDGYGGYTIMEDSDVELSKHLQAVFNAKGKVLKTGLGLGCFVRGCLANPAVEHITVIEIDPEIAEHFGRPFANDPRVTIIVADALTWEIPPDSHWDLIWHDIYCDGNEGLVSLHTSLLKRFRHHAELQGVWDLPRWAKKMVNNSGGKRRLL